MIRAVVLLLALAAAVAAAGLLELAARDAQALSVAPIVKQTECASGFARRTPNFCGKQAGSILDTSVSPFTDATACTCRTFSPLPLGAEARAVMLRVEWRALANNVANGIRQNDVIFYSTSNCAAGTIGGYSKYNVREANATAINDYAEYSDHLIVPLAGTNQICTTQFNAGGNGNADVEQVAVEGYFD